MNEINEIIVFGGIVFWILLLVLIVALFVGTWSQLFLIPLAAIVGFILLVKFSGGDFSVLKLYLPETWYGYAGIITLYCVVGVGWSVYRFYDFYKDEVNRVAETKNDWLEQVFQYERDGKPRILHKDLPPEKQKEEWNKYVMEELPKVSRCKQIILVWMVYWPIDIPLYVLFDLLYDWWEMVYEWVSGVYERIAKHLRDRILE
jgi:hypothetical protein